MPIAKISKHGLTAIAVAVALLWGFVITEHYARLDALAQRAQVMRDLRRMGRRGSPLPVSVPPLRLAPNRPHIAAG